MDDFPSTKWLASKLGRKLAIACMALTAVARRTRATSWVRGGGGVDASEALSTGAGVGVAVLACLRHGLACWLYRQDAFLAVDAVVSEAALIHCTVGVVGTRGVGL